VTILAQNTRHDIGLVELGKMIQVKFTSSGQQISKICNMCKCHIEDLKVEDILVKPKWANSSNMTFKYENGEEITRTELPEELRTCSCDNCND
jgi:hypothetical protein